jgi:ribonucleoside-diphosphate reductase alpha chain
MLQNTRDKTDKNGLLSTPPIPEDTADVNLTDNARQVLVRRYVRRGQDGKPAESVEGMFWRVAYHIAAVEEIWGGDVLGKRLLELLSSKFFPNSPTLPGRASGQLAVYRCQSDDMGRDPQASSKPRDALIQQMMEWLFFHACAQRTRWCTPLPGKPPDPWFPRYMTRHQEIAWRDKANMAVLR